MTPDNLTFQWENDSNAAFLSVTLATGADVNNFQMNMLAQNDIPHLLPVSRYQQDGVTRLSYNVTGTMRLTDVQSRMTKSQMANLLWSLSNCYKELPQYNLPLQGLLTDEEYVFLSGDENLTPSFVFLPLHEGGDNPDGLSAFIRSLIGHSHVVDADEQFSRRIESLTNQDNLTLEKFRQGVSELLPPGVISPPPPAPPNPNPTEPPPPEPIKDEKKTRKGGKKKKRRKKKPTAPPSQNRTIFIAAQGAFMILLALMGKSGVFSTEEGFQPSHLFAVALCVALADYFLYKKLFLASSASKDAKPKAHPENIEFYYPSAHTMPSGILSPEEEAEFFSDTDASSESDEPSTIEPERPAWENLDHIPRLLYQENGEEKAIPLRNSLTRVGRHQNMDYRISNDTVHMAHAFFYRENDRFFVQDRQSMKGTFLNGSTERVPIMEKMEIHPGDEIRLGDVTLKFQI